MMKEEKFKPSSGTIVGVLLILLFLGMLSLVLPYFFNSFWAWLPVIVSLTAISLWIYYACYLMIAKNRYDFNSGYDEMNAEQITYYKNNPQVTKKTGWIVATAWTAVLLLFIFIAFK